MEFYKNWLLKNSKANEEAKRRLQLQSGGDNEEENEEPQPGPSNQPQPGPSNTQPIRTTAADSIYENEDMKMIVKKGFHQHQKVFKLQVNIISIQVS